MQDFLTYTAEAIAIGYATLLTLQFIAGIPTMSHRKPSPKQLDRLDELPNDQIENSAIEPTRVTEAEAVAQIGGLWVKCDHDVLPADRPVIEDTVVPFTRPLRSLGIRKLRMLARDRGLKRYSRYSKQELLQYLRA